MRAPLELALAFLLAGCAASAPSNTSREPQPVEELGPAAHEPGLAEYLELGTIVAGSDPARIGPVREHFESALAADAWDVASRARLAIVLVNDPRSSVDDLERARVLMLGLGEDRSAPTDLRRFAGLLASLLEQRLMLARLLVERETELGAARTALAREVRGREEAAHEVEALRRALASSETKLREIVRIEQAVESSGTSEVRR